MPRVTYVKHARARYATKPVLDENGQPKRVPMTRKDGTQIVTKRGPKFLTVTERDLSKPLPNAKCDKCGTEILPGQPYKWIKPKSGPYGGRKRNRCASCPSWMVWEYSDSLDAQLARIQNDATEGSSDWTETSEAEEALSAAASEISELASEWEEKADNVVEGFGHETYVSEQLKETAEGLESMATEAESTTLTEAPDADEYTYDSEGEEVDNPDDLDESERYDESASETYADALEGWRETVIAEIEGALERQF